MMKEYWEKEGHEVKMTLYYDPAMVKWADVAWFDTCDNNLKVATHSDEPGWNLAEIKGNTQIICRVIDIEVWCGHHMPIKWDLVDDVIFVAKHIQDKVVGDLAGQNIKLNGYHLIPPGVDMEKFTFRENPVNNKKVAWVSHRWHGKGIDLFLQYATLLYEADPEYKIYAVGDENIEKWYKAYIDQFIEQNPMNVEFIEKVDDMNEFLEDKSHCITFSKKEAFSYAIGEGMAKGLKPLVHNFYGARDIWKQCVWDTISSAVYLTVEPIYMPENYRKYIKDNYSLNKMMTKIKEIINVS